MALPVEVQAKYWGIAAAVFLAVLWFLGDVLLPFVLGGAIAYFLDPVADRLERAGASRTAATAIITVGMICVAVVMALLVVPSLIRQSIALFNVAPELLRDLVEWLSAAFPAAMEGNDVLADSLTTLGETIRAKGAALLNSVLNSALGLLNVVMLMLIVPVVAVYMLLDWDNMVARIDDLLPRDHAPVIRQLAAEVDATLAGFIRGMGTVCMILGVFYAVGLWLVGLQYGLVVGVVAGLLTFIPYLGAIVGGALAVGLALFQFWGDWPWIIAVAAIFQVGQIVEGNILTPRLVGSSVGLHPVWLILSLSVFGAIFGFIGLLVAVPVAASLGVLTRFAVAQYKRGRLYQGLSGRNRG